MGKIGTQGFKRLPDFIKGTWGHSGQVWTQLSALLLIPQRGRQHGRELHLASLCRELGTVLCALCCELGTGLCGTAQAQEAELHFILSLALAKAGTPFLVSCHVPTIRPALVCHFQGSNNFIQWAPRTDGQGELWSLVLSTLKGPASALLFMELDWPSPSP